MSAFPKDAVEPFPNGVLVQLDEGTLAFQNEAVRQAWMRVRGKYA
jgi:hypothetical protein